MATKRTQRPRGFGNIEQRGPTTWRLRFSIDGKRHYETFQAPSRRAAENYAAKRRQELERDAMRRRKGLPTAVRFSQLLDEFERDEFPALSPGGRSSYLDSFKVFRAYFVELLGDPILEDVYRADVKRFLAWRQTYSLRSGRTVSGHTIARDRRVLNRLFNFALELEYVDANPVAGTSVRKPDDREYVILSQDEFERLLDAADDPMFRLYLLFLAETGVRSNSEALHVRWSDLDLSEGFVRIVSGRDGHRTKSGKSRDVPLTDRLIEALKEHAAAYRMATYHGQRSPFVFHYTLDRRAGKAGARIKGFRSEFQRAKKAAGVPDSLRIHDLRHRRATTLIEAGMGTATVQEILGHSSIVVTEKYTHLRKSHLREALREATSQDSNRMRRVGS